MLSFLINTLPYVNNSAGIRALYLLAHHINNLGYPCGVTSGECRPKEFNIAKVEPNAEVVAIYPEVLDDYIIPTTRNIRWFLNTPKFWGRKFNYRKDDWNWYYNPVYFKEIKCDGLLVPKSNLLYVPVIDPQLFYPGEEKSRECVYIGKGTFPKGFSLKDKTLITKHYPARREDLAALLRQTRVLYSCDTRTALAGEAHVCGCQIEYLDGTKPDIDALTFAVKYQGEYEAPSFVENFIRECVKRWQ